MVKSENKRSLVSVVVPVYNTGRYLSECIDSILSQTHKNIEVLLIDDGSTDGSGELCDKYAKKDNRITVVHQENSGVSSARNEGLSRSCGEYVLFVDSDDVVSEKLVDILVRDILNNEADLAICGFEQFAKGINPEKDVSKSDAKVLGVEDALVKMWYGEDIDSGPFCKLFKLSVVDDERFDRNVVIGEDLDFLCRVMPKANKICYRKDRLYFYRSNDESAMNQRYNPEHLKYLHLVMDLGGALVKEYRALEPAVNYRIFGVASYCAGKIAPHRKQYISEYRECNTIMKRYSKMIVNDKRIDKKTRIMARAYSINTIVASGARRILQKVSRFS